MGNKVRKSYFRMMIKLLMLMVCIFCLLEVDSVYAAERRNVRVAFFPMDGYHIVEEDGSYGGMDVEYLKDISN